MTTRNDTQNRGFASMDESKQREIARKGGEAVSEDKKHMAEIGRKGGESRSSRTKQRGGSKEQHSKAGKQSHKNR